MGTSAPKVDHPVRKAIHYLLKAKGLVMNDSQAVKVWNEVLQEASWVPTGDLFT